MIRLCECIYVPIYDFFSRKGKMHVFSWLGFLSPVNPGKPGDVAFSRHFMSKLKETRKMFANHAFSFSLFLVSIKEICTKVRSCFFRIKMQFLYFVEGGRDKWNVHTGSPDNDALRGTISWKYISHASWMPCMRYRCACVCVYVINCIIQSKIMLLNESDRYKKKTVTTHNFENIWRILFWKHFNRYTHFF